MTRVRPTVLALVELELWPNLIRAAKRSGAQGGDHQRPAEPPELPRLSELRGPLGPTLRLHRRGGRPGRDEYAARFVDLGVPERSGQRHRLGQVRRSGERPEQRPDARALRRTLGLVPADLVFVAGSTMEGEEAAALGAYRAARVSIPGCGWSSCRGTPSGSTSVAAWLEQQGETVLRRSQLADSAAASGRRARRSS